MLIKVYKSMIPGLSDLDDFYINTDYIVSMEKNDNVMSISMVNGYTYNIAPTPIFSENMPLMTYGRFGSPYSKPTITRSPISGMNTYPRLLETFLLEPASGVATRIQLVCLYPRAYCHCSCTCTRPFPSGSSFLYTTPVCGCAYGVGTGSMGTASSPAMTPLNSLV